MKMLNYAEAVSKPALSCLVVRLDTMNGVIQSITKREIEFILRLLKSKTIF